MSRTDDDDRDGRNEQTERAKEHLVQGLGLLFRAATEAAGGLKKGLDKTNVGRSIDDAGRELWRAANNVVSRIGTEIMFGPKDKDKKPEDDDRREDRDPPRYAPGDKPKGPTKEDPGFRIADGDDEEPR
jgi:hypothetical protein